VAPGLSRPDTPSTQAERNNQMAKRILLTGATDGIGRQIAHELAGKDVALVLHGRSPEKLKRVQREVEARGGVAETVVADFASLDAVSAMAEELLERFEVIDVLLNNAGVYMTDYDLTVDGFESTFAINHLAPFLLTHLLLERVPPSGRIINTSSIAHTRGVLSYDNLNAEKGYDGYAAYSLSKLANVLFTVELARRLGPSPTVNALHPGVVSTKLLRTGFGIEGRDSLADGAATSVFLATDPSVAKTTGRYFRNRAIADASPVARDARACARFYELSCEMTGVDPLPAI
jgi:NAD(P)-dependent dehydrogenase (short-subunit alcohol dehydrogenase family)